MIVVKNQFTEEQLKTIRSLSDACGLSTSITKILYSRGHDTKEKIDRFLSPGKKHFRSPFLLKDMKEVVERITLAKQNDETVVIYGDYDADGICASAIMYYSLRDFGINAIPVIPERADGYGLTEKLIDRVMEEYNPDLIITVDCGISGYKEVEYVRDLGADIIVTDHHELPDVLPSCLTVNCKFRNQDYPFESLCGAGVAWKLATALIGEKANKYLDFAALATVADSMPLVDENRDIVVEGLKNIRGERGHRAFKELINAAKVKEVNSTALAFALAPRVNAAGRMGDAKSALQMFLSQSPAEIFDLASQLTKYNIERQTECDELYRSAKQKLLQKGAYDRVIVLEDSSWKNGLIGIVAAKLVEEYSRPVILFVNKNGILHGSARSVEDVNILEAISQNKEHLIEFGGHSQAAGVTVSIDNLQAFEEGLAAYISQKYPFDAFEHKVEVEDEIVDEFSLAFAKELLLLEPFGTGNKKPLFAIRCEKINPQLLREGSTHVQFTTPALDMIYFGGSSNLDMLKAPVEKSIVFEPNVSTYNGKQSLKGYVKSFEVEVKRNKELGLESFRRNLLALTAQEQADGEVLKGEQLTAVINEALKEPYGTVFMISTLLTLEKFPQLKELPLYFTAPRSRNLINCVVLAPASSIDGFKRIIYLDTPLGSYKNKNNEQVYINGDIDIQSITPPISATRSDITSVYNFLRSAVGTRAGSSVELYFKIYQEVPEITRYQFVFACEVLIELGMFYFSAGKLRADTKVKSHLELSKIYTKFGGRN